LYRSWQSAGTPHFHGDPMNTKRLLVVCLVTIIHTMSVLPVITWDGTGAEPNIRAAEGTITAGPNPVFVPTGSGSGSTTISWSTSGTSNAQIWVSNSGAPETLFAAGTSGSAQATWIQAPCVYRFNLYAATGHNPEDRGELLGTAVVGGIEGDGPSIGMNGFDLFTQYFGKASWYASEGQKTVFKAMSKKAIQDAADVGIQYFRVSVVGWGPHDWGTTNNDLKGWIDDPASYWALMDEMVADLNAAGVKLVPVFCWNIHSFPSINLETTKDMMTNTNSQSYQMLTQYITEFVNRYKNDDVIYFYELTNEINLDADLNIEARTGRSSAGNYRTNEMITFLGNLAGHIRTMDTHHMISSGCSIPRTCAEHLRAKPEWTAGGPDWTSDSLAQFKKYISDTHRDMDIVSIHFYNGGGDNERFGYSGKDNAGLLTVVQNAADDIGRPLYVGEFGDVDGHMADPDAPFTLAVMDKVNELDIAFSSPWIWQFYQHNTYEPNEYNIEYVHTPVIVDKVKAVNAAMGNPPVVPESPDITPPMVILTWPYEGATLGSPTQYLYAVASDNNGPISKVEFYVDGSLKGTDTSAGFEFNLATDTLPAGSHNLVARAYDPAGNWAEWITTVTGGSAPSNNPPSVPSTPSGPAFGIVGTSYSYSTSTTDPNGDQVKYGWDWDGDGTVDVWSDLVDSGTTDTRSHSWGSPNTFQVKVKAQDEHGTSSGWSPVRSVTITEPSAVNDAEFVSQEVPTTVNAGQDYEVTVTMKNTGTSTWSASSLYHLGSQNPHDNMNWGLNRVVLGETDEVAPGQEWPFTFTITAPITVGTCQFQWRMMEEYVEWFGETSTSVAVNVVEPNQPPAAPTAPAGPSSGVTGTSYAYSASTTDPDGNQLKYGWDWDGDGTADEWSGLVSSGTADTRSHTWSSAGTYNVKVKAEDEHGASSGWSPARSVTVSAPVTGTISADPNPVILTGGATIGTTTLTWSFEGANYSQVWVSFNGGDEVLFSSFEQGGACTEVAPWISLGNICDFNLYAATGFDPSQKGALLSTVRVTAETDHSPSTPATPSGPASGNVGTSYSFSTSATDPDGDQVKYGWDWNGDGTVDEWSGLVNSGTTDTRSHSWSAAGTYNVKVKSEDSHGAQSIWSPAKSVAISAPNSPPATPGAPTGPASGVVGTAYSYSASTTDPNGDQVRYGWDWQGDGVVDDWTEYVSSGTQSTWSHTWNTAGTYNVKVMVQDESGDDSGWSPALQVTVSEVPSATGTISADPNPVVISGGSTTGTTILTWSVDGADYAQVWVDGEGFDETLFSATSTERPYSGTVDWIFKGYTYDFNLYAATGTSTSQRGALLATVEVTTETAPGETEETVVTTLTGTSQYYIGKYYSWWSINRHGQSFTAIGDSISGASVALYKYGSPSYDLTLSIRDTLKGSDLVSRTISAGSITSTSSSSPTWVTVDIPELSVVPGNTYYLVLTGNPTDYGKYYWKANKYDPYEGGNAYISNGLSAKSTYDFLAKVSFLGAEPQMLYLADFDLDGYSNGVEEESGSDPNNYWELPNDLDMDGVADLLDPDLDNDLHSNVLEESWGTDPTDPDDYPVKQGPDMADPDSQDVFEDIDGDGFSNQEELTAGTDPADDTSRPEDDYFEYMDEDEQPDWLSDEDEDLSTISWDGSTIPEDDRDSIDDDRQTVLVVAVIFAMVLILVVVVGYFFASGPTRQEMPILGSVPEYKGRSTRQIQKELSDRKNRGDISEGMYDELESDLEHIRRAQL